MTGESRRRSYIAPMTSLTTSARDSRALRGAHATTAAGPVRVTAQGGDTHWSDSLDDEWVDPDGLDAAPPRPARPAWREWLFWSFLMCMALAALPLVGARWTTPQSALTGGDCGDVLLWALPAVVALPFLFLACVGELAFRPASRTPAAWGTFAAAIVIALAALPGLFA